MQALAVIDCEEGACGQDWKDYIQISLEPPGEVTSPFCIKDSLLDLIGDTELVSAVRATKVWALYSRKDPCNA